MKKVAINGLGRIGRLMLRQYLDAQPAHYQIVALNDLVPVDNIAYLLKYDSVHGRLQADIEYGEDYLCIDGHQLRCFHQPDPSQLPWAELGIDLVIECTGAFVQHDKAELHQQAGANRVLLSAPSDSADLTLVLGANDGAYDPEQHSIVSNASCTTNSLAPVLKVLHQGFGIESAMVTTVHAYTISQGTVDAPSKKPIRGRAAAINIIPTSTGSDKTTELVLPELKGRLSAMALRVPVPDGAITEIVAQVQKSTDANAVNARLQQAAQSELQGILDFTMEPIVSSDILGDTHSGIVHGLSTRVVKGTLLKVQVWYDNEFAYAKRLLDVADLMCN